VIARKRQRLRDASATNRGTDRMSYTVDGYNRAKSGMLGDLNKALTDAADLRKSETQAADDALAAARETSVEEPASTGAVPGGVPGTPAGTAGKTA
jgi:hypothetical protein